MKSQNSLSSEQRALITSASVSLFTQALRKGLINLHVNDFRDIVYTHYFHYKREFSWRQTTDPYCIIVSEIMLQQTQTNRVSCMFEQFIEQFPDFKTLAQADTHAILAAWQGLGYNRRVLALRDIAQRVMTSFDGYLPDDPVVLEALPGVGKNTAGSVCAFAFNKPTVFIETNIRAVFIHFFFQGESEIHDKLLLPLVDMMLDTNHPRDWYYALMDYGAALKKCYTNPSRKSVHYTRQSVFQGSDRQIRGKILRMLLSERSLNMRYVIDQFDVDEEHIVRIIQELIRDNFLRLSDQELLLA